MANTVVSLGKTSVARGEEQTVNVTSTNMTPAVPPTIVARTAHVVRTFDDGEVDTVDEQWTRVADPGSPAQTVVSTEVTVLDGNGNPVSGAVVSQVDGDNFTVVEP